MHSDVFEWVSDNFMQRCILESSTDTEDHLIKFKTIAARELAKPGKPDIKNCRIIARFEFCEKWLIKCLEGQLCSNLYHYIDESIGGASRGRCLHNFVAYANSAIQQAHTWQQQLIVMK